mgnify:CR=1 FL=1
MIKSMRDRISALDISPQKDAHAGLWLDRMLTAQLKKGESVASNEQHPTKILLNQACQQIKEPAGYQNFYRRWKAALKLQNNCVLKEAKATGRLVVGLGSESAWENSITLHRTYGVPYIPGSALKGLAAAYAHRFLKDDRWRKAGTTAEEMSENYAAAHKVMFGDTTTEGYVTFFDALYVPNSGYVNQDTKQHQALWPDVITVHHPEYYRETQQEDKKDIVPPADWDDPTPIPFISATGEYLIALAGPDDWVKAAFQILAKALCELGVGAKTSSGYGRMKFREEIEAEDSSQTSSASEQASKHTYLEVVEGVVGGLNKAILEAAVSSKKGFLKNRDGSRPKIDLNIVNTLEFGDKVKVGLLDEGAWEIFEIVEKGGY